jgi:hypothetical protein
VLATLAILTCALLLGHVREVSQRRTAEEKALTLLKQWLSPAELAQYEKYSYFEVTGGDGGKRYRIRPSRQMNVDELDERGAHIAVAVAGLAIFVSWFTVVSSRGLLTGLVASVAFGGAAALLITAARSLG